MYTPILLVTSDPSKHGLKTEARIADINPNHILKGRVRLAQLNKSDSVQIEYVYIEHYYH